MKQTVSSSFTAPSQDGFSVLRLHRQICLYNVNMANLITSSERPSTNVQGRPLDGFHTLVQELSGYIDTAQSLAFSEICDPNAVIQRMKQYQSDTPEWAKYAYRDETQCFTRNMVDRGLGKSNIVCFHVEQSRHQV